MKAAPKLRRNEARTRGVVTVPEAAPAQLDRPGAGRQRQQDDEAQVNQSVYPRVRPKLAGTLGRFQAVDRVGPQRSRLSSIHAKWRYVPAPDIRWFATLRPERRRGWYDRVSGQESRTCWRTWRMAQFVCRSRRNAPIWSAGAGQLGQGPSMSRMIWPKEKSSGGLARA